MNLWEDSTCQAIPLGLQHVLAMFVGNLTPILIICGACGISATSGDAELAALQVTLLQNAMLIAGIVTLVQLFAIGPVGGSSHHHGYQPGFIGVFQSVAKGRRHPHLRRHHGGFPDRRYFEGF